MSGTGSGVSFCSLGFCPYEDDPNWNCDECPYSEELDSDDPLVQDLLSIY